MNALNTNVGHSGNRIDCRIKNNKILFKPNLWISEFQKLEVSDIQTTSSFETVECMENCQNQHKIYTIKKNKTQQIKTLDIYLEMFFFSFLHDFTWFILFL